MSDELMKILQDHQEAIEALLKSNKSLMDSHNSLIKRLNRLQEMNLAQAQTIGELRADVDLLQQKLPGTSTH